jgi:NAD(P)-dependent dehydrogenase (short-subunit alcohol dehydrogenase family)
MPSLVKTSHCVIVTGGGSGIGESIAKAFARNNDKVAVIGRNLDKLDNVVNAILADGGSARAFRADLRHSKEVNRSVDDSVKWLGGLDILVNNAGIYREGPFENLTDDVVDELIESNMKSVIYVTRASLRRMSAGGCIINIASMSGVRALDQQSIYAITKAAIVHLGACLARELASRCIRVNTISPGPTQTPILRTVATEEQIPEIEAQLISRIPLRRLGHPDDVAKAALYISSAGFATGAHLVLDGGTVL